MSDSATSTYGRLSCHVVDCADAEPEVLVVLCHGFGAPGTDLVPLAAELLAIKPRLAKGVRFVFPEGPLSLADYGLPDGRAWWHLDVAAISEMIERGELRDLRNGYPEGVVEARELLVETVEQLVEASGLPWSRVVLGGFSQGAMLAMDVALRLPEPPAAACVFSGTLIAESEWRALAEQRGSMAVLQSHGLFDPILPFEGANWLRNALSESGLTVEFVGFHGVHTIPQDALQKLAALLDQVTP